MTKGIDEFAQRITELNRDVAQLTANNKAMADHLVKYKLLEKSALIEHPEYLNDTDSKTTKTDKASK